jgi:hypothetical protein
MMNKSATAVILGAQGGFSHLRRRSIPQITAVAPAEKAGELQLVRISAQGGGEPAFPQKPAISQNPILANSGGSIFHAVAFAFHRNIFPDVVFHFPDSTRPLI